MTSFKTPSRIQVEAIECGAVALWILLGYYKKWLTSEEARSKVNITKDGSSGLDIAEALRSLGFTSEGMALTTDELAVSQPSCSYPCIAWVNKVHWIVIERYDGSQFLLSDPARGHRLATKAEFNQEYSGLVITALPTDEFRPEGRKPNPITSIISTISTYKKAYSYYVLLGVFATIPVVALSSFVGFFTDTLLEERDLSNSYIWVLSFLVGSSFLFAYLQKIVLRRTHLSLLAKLIDKTYTKLLSLPVLFYPLRDLGEISQRITLTINLSNILTGPLASAVVGLASLTIYGIIMLSYNIFLGIVVIILGLFNFLALISVSSSLSKLSQQSSMQTGKMTSNILYIANNFKQVKANGQESALFQQWADNFSLNQDNSQKSSYIQKRNSATTSFLNQLSDYIITIMSGLFILEGTMGLGQFMSFRLIALAFLSPINTLAGVNSQFSNAIGDINRLKDLWDASDDPIVSREFTELDSSVPLNSISSYFKSPTSNITPNLSIENLSYSYSPNSAPIIDSANLILSPGDLISLSGPPGSGKSTFLQCISNLIECKYSKFQVNNQDLLMMPEEFVRHKISYVSQNSFLFNGSAIDNVALFDKSISANHVQEIISSYELESFLEDLPQGLHTEVGQSSSIASSSKSMIHLLRALVRSPQVLLIDNIFQNIPPDTLSKVIQSISLNISIVVFVTQEPSLVALCNRSLVINSSKLLELNPSTLIQNMISHDSPTPMEHK
jgi:ATP-binding cassette subfamily C protein